MTAVPLLNLMSVKPNTLLTVIEDRIIRGSYHFIRHCYFLIDLVVCSDFCNATLTYSRMSASKFVQDKIHKYQHNVECSKNIKQCAGIVCFTGKCWSAFCSEFYDKHLDITTLELAVLLGGASQTLQL